MIINEMYGIPEKRYKKKNKDNGIFYILLLQDIITHIRYIKIGTTNRTINARLSDTDYNRYSFVKLCYFCECDQPDENIKIESFTRALYINKKGYGYTANDRFTYFTIPNNEFTIMTDINEFKTIKLK